MNGSHMVEAMMSAFAKRTGLSNPSQPPKRYLWTDAFAVCNYLELYDQTSEKRFLNMALALINQVHGVLGRHRPDDVRTGWISGLAESEGQQHPTQGGLRIGKTLPERRAQDPLDEEMEWERDGQYYHYLTKWMLALDQTARHTGDSRYNRWAIELAASAHAAFSYCPPGRNSKRMVWKMSIDLTRSLIPSMGHHDPLDGLICYQALQTTARVMGNLTEDNSLDAEISELSAMCEGAFWQTADTLGIGGLLMNACTLTQLIAKAAIPESQRLNFLLAEADISLNALKQTHFLNQPEHYRLAFRELGLSIGLHGLKIIESAMKEYPGNFADLDKLIKKVRRLVAYLPWSDGIEAFWLKPENQQSSNWKAHEDINSIMLATSIAPNGFLKLAECRQG